MSRKFKIIRDYHKEGEFLYQKKHVEFEPGLTVLIGCNGCGKTTLMRQVRLQVEKDLKNPCVVHFDNFADGGHNSMQVSAFHEDFSRVAQQMCSNEGERIAIDMEMVARKIGNMMHKYQNEKEFWIFLDGIDSGFSIDAIEDLKRGLFDTIFSTYPDKDIYILVTANEYEMARGEKCFDVVGCRYVGVKSYERYRNLVLKSREYKDARIEAAEKRAKKEKEEKDAEKDDEENAGSPRDSLDKTWKKER